MSIGISQLSAQRIDRIRNAESLETATEMGFIDGLIDRFFRGGAKKEAIVELYSIVNRHSESTGSQMRALLDMRSLMRPEHRGELQLCLVENPNGSFDYTLSLQGRVLDQREGITDEAAIAALRHAENAIKVDDHLIQIQNFAPQAASLVQRSDRFLVQQGAVGDCYVLAAMIGIMANPGMQETIEKMAEITADGKLRLKFDANMSAQVTSFLATASDEECQLENLEAIIGNPEELASLRAKGYELVHEEGLLRLDISEDRLKRIASELKSAQTNSLIVNILEHFVGNLLRYTVQASVKVEGGHSLSAFLEDEEPSELEIERTEIRLNPLRSDRDSLLAHQDRAGQYDQLVTNLLGYRTGPSYECRPSSAARESQRSIETQRSTRRLAVTLEDIHQYGLCLAAGGRNGFVYVSIDYGAEDKFGQKHGRHALTLQDVVFNDKGDVTGVFLINPWGNKREPEFYSLGEIVKRGGVLKEFLPPDAAEPEKKEMAAAPRSPSPNANSNPIFVMFDQYA